MTESAALPRVVLIGGLADGRLVGEFLESCSALDLVALYALDDARGVRQSGYVSMSGIVSDDRFIRFGKIANEAKSIAAYAPDLVFVVGISQIIPESIITLPDRGVVAFHSAPLPGRRGCSPVIWAIADGLDALGVTMFYMDAGVDSGDIIDVERFAIDPGDQSADVLAKADAATLRLTEKHISALLDGSAPRMEHDLSKSTFTRRRTPEDGEIHWNRPAREIVDQVRALAAPYPLAHTFGGDGEAIVIEKAHLAAKEDYPPRQYHPGRRSRTVLCVASHPDDEVLGVGATLALHAARGDRVIAVVMSEGEDAKSAELEKSSTRRDDARRSAALLGLDDIILLDFPDQRFDEVPFIELILAIEDVIRREQPEIVYTHHSGDANTDHQIIFKATYAACRPMTGAGSIVNTLLAYETPSSTDQAPQIEPFAFVPTRFVNVETVWEQKIEALKCYASELVGGIHPRSLEYIEALARMRGGYAGYRLAEAFVVVRDRTELL